MRTLIQSLILAVIPAAAYARVALPEPESLSLLAIGAVGLAIVLYRRRK